MSLYDIIEKYNLTQLHGDIIFSPGEIIKYQLPKGEMTINVNGNSGRFFIDDLRSSLCVRNHTGSYAERRDQHTSEDEIRRMGALDGHAQQEHILLSDTTKQIKNTQWIQHLLNSTRYTALTQLINLCFC